MADTAESTNPLSSFGSKFVDHWTPPHPSIDLETDKSGVVHYTEFFLVEDDPRGIEWVVFLRHHHYGHLLRLKCCFVVIAPLEERFKVRCLANLVILSW